MNDQALDVPAQSLQRSQVMTYLFPLFAWFTKFQGDAVNKGYFISSYHFFFKKKSTIKEKNKEGLIS